MSGYSEQMKTFLKAGKFAVVGASTDRLKWGNKVLRWWVKLGARVSVARNAEFFWYLGIRTGLFL
jgi:hypothetical protein